MDIYWERSHDPKSYSVQIQIWVSLGAGLADGEGGIVKNLLTTLNKIRACSPCESGWTKLLKHLGKITADDEPLPFSVILESNGLDDALWCCRAAPEYDREWRLFAVWCARQVQHLMDDSRSVEALDVAERFANGFATKQELAAAWDAAGAAAGDAAEDAARSAAGAAAGAAAWCAAIDAARAAAWDAAWYAAWYAQKEVFLWIVSGGLAEWEFM